MGSRYFSDSDFQTGSRLAKLFTSKLHLILCPLQQGKECLFVYGLPPKKVFYIKKNVYFFLERREGEREGKVREEKGGRQRGREGEGERGERSIHVRLLLMRPLLGT